MIGAVEWEPSPVKELRNHLKNRWGIQDSEERVLQFDIQRTEELFNGWKDKKFGESKKKIRCRLQKRVIVQRLMLIV